MTVKTTADYLLTRFTLIGSFQYFYGQHIQVGGRGVKSAVDQIHVLAVILLERLLNRRRRKDLKSK